MCVEFIQNQKDNRYHDWFGTSTKIKIYYKIAQKDLSNLLQFPPRQMAELTASQREVKNNNIGAYENVKVVPIKRV